MGILLLNFFQDAWCKQTCYTPWQKDYKNKPVSYGQCVVTSMYLYLLYGGVIAKDKKLNHYYNVVANNEVIDLTRDQFPIHTEVHCDGYVSFKQLFNHWDTRKRFEYLINRINALQLHEKYGIQRPNPDLVNGAVRVKLLQFIKP